MICGVWVYVCMYVYTYVCMYVCMCVCMYYVCMYIHITSTHTVYYVLAAVFASCFYVLFKFRLVKEGTQGLPLVTP
jgi:hypothetical protein